MHGSDLNRGEQGHADLSSRQVIAQRWLGLLVEKRPVEGLEGLSIGQLNRLVETLLDVTEELPSATNSDGVPAATSAAADRSGFAAETPQVNTIALGLQQLVERHLLLYERFDHPFSLMKLEVEHRGPSEATSDKPRAPVASVLEEIVRRIDWVIPHDSGCHLLLPETDHSACSGATERILAALVNRTDDIGPHIVLKASSAVCPDDSVDSEELLVMIGERLTKIELAEPSHVRRGHLRLTA